jgi:hypothetical protein
MRADAPGPGTPLSDRRRIVIEVGNDSATGEVLFNCRSFDGFAGYTVEYTINLAERNQKKPGS